MDRLDHHQSSSHWISLDIIGYHRNHVLHYLHISASDSTVPGSMPGSDQGRGQSSLEPVRTQSTSSRNSADPPEMCEDVRFAEEK